MQRFSRIERFLGKEKLQKLHNSFVAVIGLGAVGSYAVEGLARSGIGRLLLVDFDKVNPSNINRQLYALESTVGKTKTEVARDRVLDINPRCQVEIKTVFVHTDTLPEIFAEKPDMVIDAIDSLTPKAELLTYCFQNNIPAFSSMGAALRTDPTLIRVADVFDVTDCPLGFQLRRRLRKKGVGRGINCVYSTEPVNFDYHQPPAVPEPVEGIAKRGRERNILGSLPTVTGIFGLTIANAVIRILTLR
jgi:tRNA A37 threonylcarbamoyladenosine dehydratase